MCRQILANKKGIQLLDSEYGGLESFIKWLITYRGGNGNGVLLLKDGQITRLLKQNNEESIQPILDILLKEDYDWALFHTRLASVGGVKRSNIHPFVMSPSFALAFNGGEKSYTKERSFEKMGDMTDAERLGIDLYNSGEHPRNFLKENTAHSAIFGIYEGKPYLYTTIPDIVKILKKDDAILFASDFPWYCYGKNIYEFYGEEPVYWEEGENLPTDRIKKTFDANHFFDDLLQDQRVKDLIEKDPTIREILLRILYQFIRFYDTDETIYAQKKGIPQEEVDRTISVKEFIKQCRDYNIIH